MGPSRKSRFMRHAERLALLPTPVLAGLILFLSACATGGPGTADAPYPSTLRLIVVRHGEAYLNVPHPADMPAERLDSLTPLGIEQATAAGGFLRRYPVVAVIASPTGRTRQTGAIIAKAVGLPALTAEDAAFAAARDGKTPDGKTSSWSWRVAQWKAGRDPRPAGGESLEDAAARAIRAVQALATQHAGKAVVVVTHSDICAALLGHAVRTSMTLRHEKHIVPTASVSDISVSSDGAWQLGKQAAWPPAQR